MTCCNAGEVGLATEAARWLRGSIDVANVRRANSADVSAKR